MDRNRGKRASDFTRTYTVDSGKVSPTSSTSSVASENAGRLVFDTFEVAAHNVNELMQLVAMWEAEGRAKSEAEGESLGALYVNQKVENYLNKFFSRRKVFAEHFIGGDMSPQEEDIQVKDASSEYLEEQLRKYLENKESLTPGSGFFSSVPMEHTALASVFSGNDIADAASGTTDPLSEIVEKDDFYSFRSTESYPTSEDYQEIDSTSQTIIATSSMSSRGSSQQAVHTDVPSSPLGSTPEPTGEQGYLTPLQASLLAIKTAYFVETVSTTQSRSFLSVEDTSSLASCESAEEPYVDVESEDTDSNLSMLVDTDVMPENVIQGLEKDKPYTDMYTPGASGLSTIVQTNIDSSSNFLTPEDLTMRIQASQIPQAASFHEAMCSAAVEEYVSPFSSTQEPLRTSVGASEEKDNIDLNLPVQGTPSFSSSEDTIIEYQFPPEKSFPEKEVVPKSEESVDISFALPVSSSFQSNVIQEIPKSEESPDCRGSSQKAEYPDLAPFPSVSSTQEASGRQTPLTALQMSLFAVKVASSIETKSSNQARSFLSADDESPIFLPGPTEELEPTVLSDEMDEKEAKKEDASSILHVPVELPKTENFEESIPQTSQLPPFMSIQRPDATLTLRHQDFSQTPQAESLSDISQTVPVELAKGKQLEDGTPQTSQVTPSVSIQHPEKTPTVRGQDLSQIPQSSGQLGPLSEQASFTEEYITAELERFRKQYGLVPKNDSTDLMTEEVLSDLLVFGVSSDLVVEEDSSSLLTEADSSSFVAEVVSSELLAEEDSSSQIIRGASYGLVVEDESYSHVAEDLHVMLPQDVLSGLGAKVVSPVLVPDDDSYGLLTEEDSYGLVAEDNFYGLVRDDSYGMIAEEGISGAVAVEDSYGVLAEEDLFGLVAEEQSAIVVTEAYYPGIVTGQGSYGLLTGEASYSLLAEEESYAVVLDEASGVQVTEESYTLLAEDNSYELLTEKDLSEQFLQDNSYVLAEDSSLLANVDISCIIAKASSPSPRVGETSDRVAFSFSSSDCAKSADRLERASALIEKSIETNIDITPESQKQNMVPVLGRVIKVMESFYAATEAPYFAGYTVKVKKKNP